MAVGNCTEENVEYDVVPNQGPLDFPDTILYLSGALIALGVGLSVFRYLPEEATPVSSAVLVIGGLVLFVGDFFRRRRRGRAPSEAPNEHSIENVRPGEVENQALASTRVLFAGSLHQTNSFGANDIVRFRKTSVNGGGEIATIQIGTNGSTVTYNGQVDPNSHIGAPVAGVLLMFEDSQYRVELLAA